MKTEKIYQGNCIEVLKDFPDESIDCVVTSPPYWGLRDYGTAEWEGGDDNCEHIDKYMNRGENSKKQSTNNQGKSGTFKKVCKDCGAIRKDSQLGLEETPEEFVANLVKVFSEVKRVLKKEGSVWLNLGDTYYNKSLAGIPFRVAFALQSDGWYLRQDIIWHKPNPMPESVKDRCTKSHEYIFLLSKSPKYFYDIDAIREPATQVSIDRSKRKMNIRKITPKEITYEKVQDPARIVREDHMRNKRSVWKTKYGSVENESKHRQGMHKQRGESVIVTRKELPEQKEFVDFIRNKSNAKKLSEDSGIKLSKVEHWFRHDESGFAYPSIEDWDKIREYLDDWSKEFISIDKKMTELETHLDSINNNPKGKNKRSVWKITTKPYKEAHFATFPIELPITCIKAGCPEGGIVLDPFFGSGTTGLAAQELSRHWVGIELNPEYIEIAKRRTSQSTLFV